jgi:hypothetical protein
MGLPVTDDEIEELSSGPEAEVFKAWRDSMLALLKEGLNLVAEATNYVDDDHAAFHRRANDFYARARPIVYPQVQLTVVEGPPIPGRAVPPQGIGPV